MWHCLIVEDDEVNARYVAEGLRQAGHAVTLCSDGVSGLDLAFARRWDVIILDRMLPRDVDGLSILAAIRRAGHKTPVIILSALTALDERVRGLTAGGDDYLAKPFAFSELAARIQALIRRSDSQPVPTLLEVSDLRVDLLKHRVERAGKPVPLQPREFRLLAYMMANPRQVLTRTMLLESVWDYHFDPQTNVIDVHISRLRQKIDVGARVALIHTVRGVGYILAEDGAIASDGDAETGKVTASAFRWLRSLLDSVSFRLALNYGLLAVFTMLVLISVFYIQTIGVLKQANERQVATTVQRMLHNFERGGRAALVEAVKEMLADGSDSDTELYLLRDEHGAIVAGNLPTLPDVPSGAALALERPVLHNGRTSRALLLSAPLPDGASLIVGREMSDQSRIETVVEHAALAAAAVALLLVIGGTIWFRATLEGRVETIRRTTRHVGAGDLSSRVPLPGQEDEFARLDRDINQMLDRIENLMEGVRHVSNTIAHEMRTPMARILAALRTADRPGATDREVRLANRAAVRELEALTAVFDKLLQIAEAESGTRRQAFRQTEIDQIMRDVIDLFTAVADEQGSSLLDRTGRHLTVLGDRDLLAGAISNLVENALKYTRPGARIRVGADREGDAVVLTVRDDGPGVPAPSFKQLGTRFYRLDRSLPGFGLGLASVLAVAKLHGGSVEFSDAGPGLSVQIRLPASRP